MKKLLVAVTVSVFAVVLLAGLAQAAAPSVVGTRKGSAPKITSAAVCSTTAVTLSITKQCGKLFAGKATITGSTVAIPFVGRLIYDAKTAGYSGWNRRNCPSLKQPGGHHNFRREEVLLPPFFAP